jgi:hypothetical protein
MRRFHGGSRRVDGLWRNHDFLKLWSGETVSLVGSQVTDLALPLAAILTLRAGASQSRLQANKGLVERRRR